MRRLTTQASCSLVLLSAGLGTGLCKQKIHSCNTSFTYFLLTSMRRQPFLILYVKICPTNRCSTRENNLLSEKFLIRFCVTDGTWLFST